MSQIKFSDYFQFLPKQLEALQYIGKGYIIFYGGARGGGKSMFALGAAVLSSIQYPTLKTLILRKNYKELEELFVDRMYRFFPPDVFKYQHLKKQNVFVFENGSKITLRSVKHQKDVENLLGLEYQLAIIDEANQFEIRYLKPLLGSMRNPNIPNWKTTVIMTGNPLGMSDNWFISHFVNIDYTTWEESELRMKDKFVFVQATVEDNPILTNNDPNYVEWLLSLPDYLRDAWYYGKWGTSVGRFFSSWNPAYHVVHPFEIPSTWRKFASIDEGHTSEHPTVILFGAQDPETKTVYIYKEYISEKTIEEIYLETADMIVQEKLDFIVADPAIFFKNKRSINDVTLIDLYLSHKPPIYVLPANNERIAGWRVVKTWMNITQNKTRLKFFTNCVNCINNIPNLLYATTGNIEDCNTRMRDDEADALRYMLMEIGMPPEITETEEDEKQLEVVFEKPDEYWDYFLTVGYDGKFKEVERRTYQSRYNTWLNEGLINQENEYVSYRSKYR
jgi:phage terminase large subunit